MLFIKLHCFSQNPETSPLPRYWYFTLVAIFMYAHSHNSKSKELKSNNDQLCPSINLCSWIIPVSFYWHIRQYCRGILQPTDPFPNRSAWNPFLRHISSSKHLSVHRSTRNGQRPSS